MAPTRPDIDWATSIYVSAPVTSNGLYTHSLATRWRTKRPQTWHSASLRSEGFNSLGDQLGDLELGG